MQNLQQLNFFIGKYRAAIGKELVGNAVICENLMKNMVITIEGLLGVKPAAGNASGRIIDGQMQMPDLSGNPFMGSRIHLLQFMYIIIMCVRILIIITKHHLKHVMEDISRIRKFRLYCYKNA